MPHQSITKVLVAGFLFAGMASAKWTVTLTLEGQEFTLDSFAFVSCITDCGTEDNRTGARLRDDRFAFEWEGGGNGTIPTDRIKTVVFNRFLGNNQGYPFFDVTIQLKDGKALEHVALELSHLRGLREGIPWEAQCLGTEDWITNKLRKITFTRKY